MKMGLSSGVSASLFFELFELSCPAAARCSMVGRSMDDGCMEAGARSGDAGDAEGKEELTHMPHAHWIPEAGGSCPRSEAAASLQCGCFGLDKELSSARVPCTGINTFMFTN